MTAAAQDTGVAGNMRRLGDLELAVLDGTASTADQAEYLRLVSWHEDWLREQPGSAEQEAEFIGALAAAFGTTADELGARLEAARQQGKQWRAARVAGLESQSADAG